MRKPAKASRGAIGVVGDFFVTMAIERNSGDAGPVGDGLIDIPVVVGGISRDMGRELLGSHNGTLEEGTKIGDIRFVERQGELGQHHIAIDRIGACRHARAIAKEAFLFDFLTPVGLFLIAAFLDAQPTIRIAFGDITYIKRPFDVDTRIVLAHPGVDVLDIKGDGFAQAGDGFV